MQASARWVRWAVIALTLGGWASAHAPSATGQRPTRGVASDAAAGLLYSTFQDHAVLQRNEPIAVWGRTAPGAKVRVHLASETAGARAGTDGHWRATLPPLAAGGPYTLSASSSAGTRERLTDVMIGDVYLCSGQSNMEYPTRLASDYDADVNSAHNSLLRLFHVQRFRSVVPRDTFGAPARWEITSPESVREFSAACYFFGRDLQPTVHVPVGLIESAWGGSLIQAWLSPHEVRHLGGHQRALRLLSTYRVSPRRAWRQWDRIAAAWWHAHDPASAASPPWYAPSYDDSAWARIVPIGTWRIWHVPQLETFNGLVWLRKDFTLSAKQAAQSAVLDLGAIDQSDIAWVNGIQVGAGEGYDVPRNYTVGTGVLHPGRNVVAIGIFGGAGLLRPANELMLKLAGGKSVRLSGEWRYKTSARMSVTGQIPHVPWLNQFGLTVLYNGMIKPLGETRVRGIVWYQGESNANEPKVYARLLPALIRDWRRQFGSKTPFLIVQLPGFGPYHHQPRPSDWAQMREVQRLVVKHTAHTGLAVTIDVGSRRTIHPTDKQDVGRRLALLARDLIYHQRVDGVSPEPISARRVGRDVQVGIDTHGSTLEVQEWNRPLGFQLCDRAGHCAYVDARLRGTQIKLNTSAVPRASEVRYCWDDSPLCNLYDRAGLPVVPFELPIKVAAHAGRAR